MQHLASGGDCSAARSRGVREDGRCTTETRSNRSVAMPETCPRIQLFGNGLGQNGSTWNAGTGLAFWPQAWPPHIATAMTNDAILILTLSSRSCFSAQPLGLADPIRGHVAASARTSCGGACTTGAAAARISAPTLVRGG